MGKPYHHFRDLTKKWGVLGCYQSRGRVLVRNLGRRDPLRMHVADLPMRRQKGAEDPEPGRSKDTGLVDKQPGCDSGYFFCPVATLATGLLVFAFFVVCNASRRA